MPHFKFTLTALDRYLPTLKSSWHPKISEFNISEIIMLYFFNLLCVFRQMWNFLQFLWHLAMRRFATWYYYINVTQELREGHIQVIGKTTSEFTFLDQFTTRWYIVYYTTRWYIVYFTTRWYKVYYTTRWYKVYYTTRW